MTDYEEDTRQDIEPVGPGAPTQAVLQFRTGEFTQTASAWRQALLDAGALTDADLPAVRVFAGQTALSLIAANPSGNPILIERMPLLAKAVCERVGKPIPFELMEKQLTVREDDLIWDYVTPRLCVAKAEPAWTRMKAEVLAAEDRMKLKTRIERDLLAQAVTWGLALPSAPRIGLLDAGRPMPVAAITGARSGHGKDQFVLARLQVRLICNLRFNGDWCVGALQGLGFGRLFRDGYAGHDQQTGNLPDLCVREFMEESHA